MIKLGHIHAIKDIIGSLKYEFKKELNITSVTTHVKRFIKLDLPSKIFTREKLVNQQFFRFNLWKFIEDLFWGEAILDSIAALLFAVIGWADK